MAQAVPARKANLDEVEVARLRELTAELAAAKPEAAAEYARFLGVKRRGLCLPGAELDRRLGGATVMVTGATGCIGSTLMAQLARHRPGRLVGVSRGMTTGWPRQAGADYLVADARDRARLDEIIAQVRPDVIFHVAAQRSPALAEVDVHGTVTTNVLGTRNVLAAAAAARRAPGGVRIDREGASPVLARDVHRLQAGGRVGRRDRRRQRRSPRVGRPVHPRDRQLHRL